MLGRICAKVEIFFGVIRFSEVDVVYNFGRLNSSTNNSLHNFNVLVYCFCWFAWLFFGEAADDVAASVFELVPVFPVFPAFEPKSFCSLAAFANASAKFISHGR